MASLNLHDQCGGSNFKTEAICGFGLSCQFLNSSISKCLTAGIGFDENGAEKPLAQIAREEAIKEEGRLVTKTNALPKTIPVLPTNAYLSKPTTTAPILEKMTGLPPATIPSGLLSPSPIITNTFQSSSPGLSPDPSLVTGAYIGTCIGFILFASLVFVLICKFRRRQKSDSFKDTIRNQSILIRSSFDGAVKWPEKSFQEL